jgi:hypothetical protein
MDAPTGLYVPPLHAPALRAALSRLLADAPLREALGAAARETAVACFDTSRFVAILAERLGAATPAPVAPPPGRLAPQAAVAPRAEAEAGATR